MLRSPRERRDQEDKVVWVNATRYVIRRGETVEVPENVAKILENEETMLREMYAFDSAHRTD